MKDNNLTHAASYYTDRYLLNSHSTLLEDLLSGFAKIDAWGISLNDSIGALACYQ